MNTAIAAAPRGVITSKARACEIVETVAAKHDLPVQTVLCARWDRYAIAARAEIASELSTRLNWSTRRIGAHIGCTHANVRKLFGIHKLNMKRGARWLPAADVHAIVSIRNDERLMRMVEAEERAAYAEAELARLTGDNLAVIYADALGLTHRLRCAIVLAIVAEAYPRLVLGAELIEHYDEACVKLGYGDQKGANFNLMTKNVAHLREHFEAQGWPAPINITKGYTPRELVGSRRLTDEGAEFLHERLGAPKLSQIEAAREQRSARVRAVVVR
jgi:hypothetical protein